MPSPTEENVALEIAHVLFIDVVGYSKKLTNEQRELFQTLNQVVCNTWQFQAAEAAGRLVRLPTGDGMALAFFTSVDAPARCAREIGSQLREHPHLKLRMGINSGPVEEVTDVNGRRNVTGAGINLAQRVMDCGDAGHILLARRVADDLGQYTEWKPYLHDLGEVEVKHGVKVPIVNFFADGIGNSAVPEKIRRTEEERTKLAASIRRQKRRRIVILASTALVLLLGITVGSWTWQRRIALTSAYKAGITPLVEKSIAVLPFENVGDDKQNAYLADGVQDDILTDLTKVADLKVIGRRSVAQYRDSKESIRQIGQALQVAHVLQGTVRKVADRIHVTAQLIDTRSEVQTWAEKYDTDLADVIQIQNEISGAIVAQLKVALSPAERSALEEKPTHDKEAYDLYMQARALIYEPFGIFGRQAEENAAKAVTLLEAATARDRNFALAYCALADAHFGLNEKDKAKQAIDNALRISPALGEAHLLRARYLFEEDEKKNAPAPECWTAGEKELAIAAAALPARVEVFDLRAAIEGEQGKWKQALADREKAAQLDPRDRNILQALIELYITLRRYDQAERLLDHVIQITPQESTGGLWRQKCSIALARGDTKAAMAALDSSPVRNSGSRFLNHAVARVLLLQREYQKADEILQTVENTPKANKILPKSFTPMVDLFFQSAALVKRARIAHYRGESDKARQLFEAARPGFEKWLSPGNADSERWADSHSMIYLAEIDAALGRKADALRQGRQALELWPLKRDALLGAEVAASLAIVYLFAGERESALQQLSEAVKLPAWGAAFLPAVVGLSAGDLKLNPMWDELRSDPRFNKIIAETAKPIRLE